MQYSMVRSRMYPSAQPHLICWVIILGIVVVLFFQCMHALFDPVNRTRGGIKWGLVAHTVAMFSFATIYAAMSFNIQSISFIDNRNFPGVAREAPPGPFGYQLFISSTAIAIAPTPMILINDWLAVGLLVSVSSSAAHVPNVDRSSSSIVATSFTLRTTGRSSSHA